MKKLKQILLPFEDSLTALDNALGKSPPAGILLIVVSFIVSWWIYVPVHELFHAFGCILGGGTVSELDISPKYGMAFLSKIFPFVSPGSDYAGQLTGFDTGGSDLTFLLTDLFPFLLTIFVGVPLLRSASRSATLPARIKLGVSIPIAFAPFISFSGNYYEMGSIIVSRIAAFFPSVDISRLRRDDLFKLSKEIFFSGSQYGVSNIACVFFSFILGIMLIYLTYLSGVVWSGVLFDNLNKRPAT